jgi:hypothetical protein
MIYEVINQPKKLSTQLLDHSMLFACEYLDIDEDIVLEFDSLKRHQYGFCDYDEDEIKVVVAKRLSSKDVVRTIFHEMVHVKQHLDGRLKFGYIWEGEVYDCEYETKPWEVEAFYEEEKMMQKFWSVMK